MTAYHHRTNRHEHTGMQQQKLNQTQHRCNTHPTRGVRGYIADMVAINGSYQEDRFEFKQDDLMQKTRLSMLPFALLVLVSTSGHALDNPDLPEAFTAGWEGKKTCEIMYETEEVRVAQCSFPAGTGHEAHFHNPHFGYVLEGGTMRITNELDEIREVETVAGTTWSTSNVTAHSVLNTGDTETRYIIVEPKISTDQ